MQTRRGSGTAQNRPPRRRWLALGVAFVGGGAIVMGTAPRLARLSGRITWAPPARRSGRAGLAYRLEGHGVPATVLVHGLFASGRYWGKAYDGLARDSALMVPDLAGFGRSVEVVDGFGP